MDVLIDGEIVLYGMVGEGLFGDGFSALNVVQALAEIGRGNDVTVRVNSPGGFADEGAAIYNAFRAHRGRVTIYVDAVAASAASLIAMSADNLVMRRGSYMMIHDPAGITVGDAAAHAKTIEGLEAIANTFADVYAEKSGRSLDEVRSDMIAETWLTPDQAVELGYADRTEDAGQAAPDPVAFNYRAFQHAPARYVAMADKNGWAKRSVANAAPSAASPRRKETPMANEPADRSPAHDATLRELMDLNTKHAEAKALAESATARAETERQRADGMAARMKAILDSEEAKGREDQARMLAFETELPAEQAIKMLAASHKAPEPVAEPKPKAVNRFDAAMAAAGNPQVGLEATATEDDGVAFMNSYLTAARQRSA